MKYDPADPVMLALITAIWTGEGKAGPNDGFGYVDLSAAPRTSDGFPIWSGVMTKWGMTHAAGRQQFEPGTWHWIAQIGLDFRKAADQDAGAWALAQDVVGPTLRDLLKAGQWRHVGSLLLPTWPGGGKGVMAVTA